MASTDTITPGDLELGLPTRASLDARGVAGVAQDPNPNGQASTDDAENQPQHSAVDRQDDIQSDTSERGFEALADMQDADPRFDFYPTFSFARRRVLNFLAGELSRLQRDLRLCWEDVEDRLDGEPLPERWVMLMTEIKRNLMEYDTFTASAKTIAVGETPRQKAVNQLQHFLGLSYKEGLSIYSYKDTDMYIMLGPKRGPTEKLVKEVGPEVVANVLYRIKKRLHPHSPQNEEVESYIFSDKVLSQVYQVVLLLGVCTFIVLPLELLSYRNNMVVQTALAVSMCILASLLAFAVVKDEERRIILVCAYWAIMVGLLTVKS